MRTGKNTDKLLASRVIPVRRLRSRKDAETAIDCLIEAGFRTVELTLTTPGAIELIASLRRSGNADFLVGAGTVLDLGSAQDCLDAGADYLVSPCLVPGMAALANIEGYKVDSVDATGAGDCFAGALLARMSAGDDFWQGLRFANAAAALTTAGYGAVAPLPRPEAVRQLLNRG